MDIEKIQEQLSYINENWSWITQVFIVVFITVFTNFLQRKFLNRLHKRLSETKNIWDDSVIDAARRPITLLIWIIGLSFAAKIVQTATDAILFASFDTISNVAVIATIGWFLVRLINNVEKNYVHIRAGTDEALDVTTVDAIGKLLRISVIITASLVVLQTLGFSVSGILAFGGIGGIAIGFAAKDLLANFFGGLMIYLDRPFAVGEWIRSPDKQIEGTVENIGWRLTRIRTFDKRPIYVPNSIFTSITVENPSRMSHRRIYETIGIRYDDADKMRVIVADVKTMLLSHPEIDTTQTIIVNFNAYAPSSMDFFVYVFTKTTDWIHFHEVKEDVLLKIYDIIVSHAAEVAFPTSTIHMAAPGIGNVSSA